MKAHYRFLYKAVAVFLYGIFAMGIGYCGIYLLLCYASPEEAPVRMLDHQGLLILGLGLSCLGLLATLTYLMRGAGRRQKGFSPAGRRRSPWIYTSSCRSPPFAPSSRPWSRTCPIGSIPRPACLSPCLVWPSLPC